MGIKLVASYRILLLLLICIDGPVAAAESFSALPELAARQEIMSQAKALYDARNFQEIDARSKEYIEKSTRTPSGLWVSGIFGYGIELAVLNPKPGSIEEWDHLEHEILQWAKSRGDSSIARIVYAEVVVTRAWSIRGGKYASEVPENAWKPFHDQLMRARHYLEEEKRIASRDPRYYELQITIAKGLGGDSPLAKEVFDDGMSKFPGFYPMYFAMLDYLLPKWHGGPLEIERFAREATQRARNIEGEGMYARIYWYAAQIDFEDALFWTSFARWEQMRVGFEDVISRYPDQWNIQNFAHFACQAGDAKTMSKLLMRIERPIIAEAWAGSSSFQACEQMAGRINL